MQNTCPDKRIEVWYHDEARYGQQGRLTYGWHVKGTRPRVYRQKGFKSVWLNGAVNPENGKHFGLVLPTNNTDATNIFLSEFKKSIDKNKHIILVMDNASWHHSKHLDLPKNITLHFLPPYSPELNPIERLWQWMKNNFLSNRIFKDMEEIVEFGILAWKNVTKEIAQSVCRVSYLKMLN